MWTNSSLIPALLSLLLSRLVGLVVKASASTVAVVGSSPAVAVHPLAGSRHATDSRTASPAPTLPGAWRFRVGAGTGWPGVRVLWVR